MPKKQSFEPELDSSLIRSIISPIQSPTQFGNLCNRLPALYGSPNSSRRKAVTNRKFRLAKKKESDPEGFRRHCISLGIDLDRENKQEDEEIKEDYPVSMTKNFRSVKPDFLDDDEYDSKRKYSIRCIG